jgi:hypothetical protein
MSALPWINSAFVPLLFFGQLEAGRIEVMSDATVRAAPAT